MRPCTVVLRRQLPTALRLATTWAELHPDAAPLLVLVVDGTNADPPTPPCARVIDPGAAGLDPHRAALVRLTHRVEGIVGTYGPWAMQAALADATGDVALLLDPRARLDAAAADHLHRAALLAAGRAVVGTDLGFVAADLTTIEQWQRRVLQTVDPHDHRRDLIEHHDALVLPTTLTLDGPGPLPNDQIAWTSQRDGTRLPSSLIAHTVGWFVAHLDGTHPESAPHAAGAAHRFEVLARDLLAGTPRDLRTGDTERARASVPAPPPDPFGPDPAAYRSWLATPVTAPPHPVSRALADVHRRRPDLHETFPDLDEPEARRGLLEWAAAFGTDDDQLPTWLLPEPPGPAPVRPDASIPAPALSRAVLVAGYLDAALGLGEAARLMVRALDLAGERLGTRTYRHLISPGVDWQERPLPPGMAADIHLLCLNGAAIPRFARSVGPRFSRGRHVVGLWFWEAERLTPVMRDGFEHVDEVWTTSEYSAAAIRTDAPARCSVHLLPLGVRLPPEPVDPAVARLELGLPRGWLAGFSFDHGSMLERKNPLGLIDAWRRAFPDPATDPDQGPHLLLKTMNSASHPTSARTVRAAIAGRPDITLIDETWTPAQQHHFVAALDLYASLHRAEGYGLLLLEAMAVGTPVMATGATGNLAFMHHDNSWLVPAQRTVMQRAYGPYDAGSVVHEPDVDAAAAILRELHAGRGGTAQAARIQRARDDTRALADGSAAAAWVRQRLATIRASRHSLPAR